MMARIIHADELTREQRDDIAKRYGPYHRHAEFWVGFVDYQAGRLSNPYGSDSVGGRGWDRGAEAAMNLAMNRLVPRGHAVEPTAPRSSGCLNEILGGVK
jgi:hypothetical protein